MVAGKFVKITNCLIYGKHIVPTDGINISTGADNITISGTTVGLTGTFIQDTITSAAANTIVIGCHTRAVPVGIITTNATF